jgi:hypothetical protein
VNAGGAAQGADLGLVIQQLPVRAIEPPAAFNLLGGDGGLGERQSLVAAVDLVFECKGVPFAAYDLPPAGVGDRFQPAGFDARVKTTGFRSACDAALALHAALHLKSPAFPRGVGLKGAGRRGCGERQAEQ